MASAAARIEPPKSNGENLSAIVAPELQRHQRQQHRLAAHPVGPTISVWPTSPT